MLYEIECDQFIDHGKPRGKIRFHEGLNSILGDKDAQNSIGKSTFLLIIDFCLGGDDYKKNNAKEKVGNHTIKFALKDTHGKLHYFARDTLHPTKVNICDANYYPSTEVSIDDFRRLLLQIYGLTIEDITFRQVVGRFMRIYGRETCKEKKPITISKETDQEAIFNLEKMFGLYAAIKDDRAEAERTDHELKVYKAAQELNFVSYASYKTVKDYKEAQKELEKLRAELKILDEQQDVDATVQEAETLEAVREIKAHITRLKRQRDRLISQQTAVEIGSMGERLPTGRDIAELERFFPGVNVKQLERIQAYHRKLQGILQSEVSEELSKLEMMVQAIDEKIKQLQAEQRKYGEPTKLPMDFLNRHTELSKKIDETDGRLLEYERSEQLRQDAKDAQDVFDIAQDKQLRKMESTINTELINLNEHVYNGERYAPSIDFKKGKSYDYHTPDDDGTGTNYRSLILFDLMMLSLTELPVVAHDSLIFKNIAVMPVDDIMKLYMNYKKQIFIVFDKKDAVTEITRATLEKTKVLELEENGGELFGWSWAKRVKKKNGDIEYRLIETDANNET